MAGIADGSDGAHFERSGESESFERMWRGLPRNGPLPERHAFRPRSAKAFLPHLLLAEAPSEDNPTLRVRVVGDAIRSQILGDIVGQDFLDFVPEPERKAGVLEIARALFSRPCGVWWVAPVHYERGFSQFWELTAFPLARSESGSGAVLVHVRPFAVTLNMRRTDQKAIRLDAALELALIAI